MHESRVVLNRRSFLQRAAAFTSVAALGSSPINALAKSRYQMGLQLYTVRDPMALDPVATFNRIASLGYRNLETYGFDADAVKYYGFSAKDFKQVLDDLGLRTSSGHYDLFLFLNKPIESLQAHVDRCIQGALALNQKYITWPWLDPNSRGIESFQRLAERLNIIGEQIHNAGLKLAYHNHDFEFVPHDGKIGYDIVMHETDPNLVKLQLDLFWATHSSARTPHELFKLQPGRFVMWHIKDMDKRDRNRYTELGNGTIDFTQFMPDASLAGLEEYFVEQGDNFAVSPMQSIADSARYVHKYLE